MKANQEYQSTQHLLQNDEKSKLAKEIKTYYGCNTRKEH